jgi:hypothetical protein
MHKYYGNRSKLIKFKKAFIKKVKLKFGCFICGYKKHSMALHFDHINPKTKSFGISGIATTGYGIKRLKEEISKKM